MNNKQLGELIGVSFSMASRLQSGDRTPGIDTMRQISQVFDFPLESQVSSRERGDYADRFARAIALWEHQNQSTDDEEKELVERAKAATDRSRIANPGTIAAT